MRTNRLSKRAATICAASASLCAGLGLMCPAPAAAAPPGNVTVFATGLNNPRGLAFGPDGDLYVAEGGLGGDQTTTPADCAQVPAPVGPYSGGFTARISKIGPTGVRTTLIDGLPSSQTSPLSRSLVSGVADVAFVGDQLYGLDAGAGCSHGLLGTDNSLFRVNPDGTATQVADLSAYVKSHPVAHPDLQDFEPDGTWYSMIAVHGQLYAVEPNHEEIDRISPTTGTITRVVDLSQDPWWGPTSIAYHGTLYVGDLGPFPISPGTQQIRQIAPDGTFTTWATGLTTVLGLAFDHRDRLYALESMPIAGFPGPQELGQGQVVRIDPDGTQTVIATELSFPSAITLGPDGDLYVSNNGFGAPPGAGQILRITTT